MEKLQRERDELRDAVRAYRDAKGRYHTQKACERLLALLPENVKRIRATDQPYTTMQTNTDTLEETHPANQETEVALDGATCSASLSPVAYRINQQQSPHAYWIQRMILGVEGPQWFILLRLGDPAAFLASLKEGYATPEDALQAWREYADRIWPNAEVSHGCRERQPDTHPSHNQP
jgi:hypothetical protein